jgi:uncharacterized membrane protein YeaQ/YmgE (transglycosylase-associated protein family)
MSAFLGFFATVLGGWIIFNLIGAFLVGWLARAVFPGKDKIGWFTTLVVGFFGGIVGKLIFWLLRWPSGFPMGFVASVVGAFVLLLVYHVHVSTRSSKPA